MAKLNETTEFANPTTSQQCTARSIQSKKMKQSYIKFAIIFIVGAIAIIVGISTGICWSLIFNWFFTKEFTLSPTSKIYSMWKETPIPMYLEIYMFNWTNPEEFGINQTSKPNFIEMGPYVFREVDYKVNNIWNANNTVTFQRRRVWHFDTSLSKGSLEDKVTNINPIATTVAYTIRNQKNFVRDVIDRIMVVLGEKRTITKTVNEFLFQGYDDKMLKIVRKFNATQIPMDKFGWFYQRNGSDSYDGTFNMFTGKNNLQDLGIIKEWNYSNRSKFYEGNCGMINGTNGDLWPPLPYNKTIDIFISDICTSINLNYDNLTTFQGISGNRYVNNELTLDNGTLAESRKCYCQNVECQETGAMNISLCKYGAPAFISFPHFYLADENYRNSISMIKADKERDESFLAIEPITGIPLEVRVQLQLNLLVQPDQSMSLFKDIPRTYFPILYFAQTTNLTSDYASLVKFLLIMPSLGAVTAYGIAAIGFLIVFIGVFIYIRQKWQSEDRQGLITKGDNENINQNGG